VRAPNRILAAVDFSDRSQVALGFAARLACQFNADLHVMHAQDPLLSAAAQHRGIDLARETEDELRASVAATWPATRCGVHFDVIVGHAATSIANAAERECADVIVMAAHGMSGAQHALLGSTTDGVLRRSNTSVLVVPDAWEAARPEVPDLSGEGPVIAGVDFRIPAIEAAADAAVLAASLRTELMLVHIVPAMPVLARWREHAEAALVEKAAEAKREIERIAAAVNGGVPTRVVVERGRVASCLSEVAHPHPHGIIVVGRSIHPHGYAPPGKTAYRVLTEARLPVLMHVAR
jgi:nucleotide-binding universal stress UspA family protein